jgi:tight adherence protein C
MGRISRTLLIAQERGTPIAQTLNALSAEIRSETRRQLLEIAAKKDVTMMVPVVFGILPSITAIALYPAFISLSIM